MKPQVIRATGTTFATAERCTVEEVWNGPEDEALSIAVARVEPGVTTQRHALDGSVERYVILSGKGQVRIGDERAVEVRSGDVVVIPPGVAQSISNVGTEELCMYCLCTPRFRPEMYRSLEDGPA